MNMLLQSQQIFGAPFSSIPESSANTDRWLDWLAITEEQAAHARFILSDEFLKSDNPFHQPRYLEIGYPLKVGNIQDRNAILESDAFCAARGERNFWYLTGGSFPKEYECLKNACAQFVAIDYCYYGQRKVLWHFTVDVKELYSGMVQRSFVSGEENTVDEPYHVDGDLQKKDIAQRLFADIRSGNHEIVVDRRLGAELNDRKIKISGIPRIYVTAASNSDHENCFTEFENVGASFANWDIAHFVAESHRSRKTSIHCTRFFLRGVARPIRS